MNAPKIATITALVDQFAGWVVEYLGRVVGSPTRVSLGRSCQLRAMVTLRCAQVKADAKKSMRSWKLLDTRLLRLSMNDAASAR